MRKSILDTDILSEYLKGHDRNVAKRAEAYAQIYGVFSFTSVTVYGVVYGLEWKSAFTQLRKALRWIQLNEEIVPQAADFLVAASMKAASAKARLHCGTARLFDCCCSHPAPYHAGHR